MEGAGANAARRANEIALLRARKPNRREDLTAQATTLEGGGQCFVGTAGDFLPCGLKTHTTSGVSKRLVGFAGSEDERERYLANDASQAHKLKQPANQAKASRMEEVSCVG